MITALEKIYGDKNKKNRAINELRTLRMGRKTFGGFYADFARCATEIGYTDDALIPLLENAISDELAGRSSACGSLQIITTSSTLTGRLTTSCKTMRRERPTVQDTPSQLRRIEHG